MERKLLDTKPNVIHEDHSNKTAKLSFTVSFPDKVHIDYVNAFTNHLNLRPSQHGDSVLCWNSSHLHDVVSIY